MAKFLSNRQRSLDLGINNYTEGSDVLTITGNTNISGIVTAIAGAAVTYYGDGSKLTGIGASQVGALADIVTDTTPQLGGDLDLNSNDITGNGNININGITTAISFYGDGSNLTNLPPASVSISTTAPTSPSTGDLWYSPDYARTLIYYDDGSSQQWIDAAPFNVGFLTVTNFTASNLNVTSGLNVTGVITATSFVKSGGTSSQFLKADGSVDSSTYITSADGGNADQLDGQEGTYYLDYNNFTNTPTIPTNNNQLTNGAGFITASDDITGNAATATQLETARNIGGVSFDGTADINLPGVNAAGNQNTSGTAAGLSGAPSITVTDITATGNVSIAGTLTYEDVTSVDSVGLITARTGVRVTTGGIDISAGGLNVTGVTTSTSFVKSGGTSSQFLKADGSVDTNTYLTSFTETNDLSSAVTWANVPDANITQSSVTQHQAALSITESQISDLQSYLTSYTETQTLNDVIGLGNTSSLGISVGVVTASSFVKSGGTSSQFLKADGSVDTNTYLTSFTETNDLSSAVTWTNVPDANITQSSVTQHQAALSITESQISDLQSYLTDVVDDTTPQLGGDLDLNSNDITGTGNINITGTATFSGDVSIGGTLTYEDVTNVDSVGLVTARSGVRVTTGGIEVSAGGAAITGVSTFQDNVRVSAADSKLFVGQYSSPYNSQIELRNINGYSYLYHYGSGTFHIALASGNTNKIQFDTISKKMAEFYRNGSVKLYYNGSEKFKTTNDGVIVTGIATATSYYGDGSNLTGLPVQGVGINTVGGSVGTGVTILDFRGAGISTVTVTAGIATLNITGGGGNGSISISTIAPTSPTSGDLWYSPDYGRTFIYYDESSVGYGTSKQWVDAAPFSVGILSTTSLSLVNLEVTDNAIVSGITTLGNTVVGGASTELVVNGDARITGILTIGTSSITLDGTNNTINVGSLSLSESGISGATPDINTKNINSSGIITATSFVKSGGTSSQFLKADGSVDSSTYITSADGGNADQLDGQEGTYYLNYNNFTNTPTIPTNNNQLTNGAGYITSSDNITGTSGGLSGSPSITVTDITAVGNVSIAGTLTYEDVTSVDSVGLVTARTGVRVTTGGIDISAGGLNVTGVSTFTGNINVTGTVDGRDVATDGSKLDGIESGATADQTASEILTAIKTVDGSGSGLDADLLDGQQGSYYLNYNNFTNTPTIPTNNNQLTNGAGYITSADGGNAATLDSLDSSQFLRSDANDSYTGTQLTFTSTGVAAMHLGAEGWQVSSSDAAYQRADARDDGTNYSRLHWYGVSDGGATSNFRHAYYDGAEYINVTSSSSTLNFQRTSGTAILQVHGNTVWHAGNDGSGSGLDADLLDGQQGSYYLNTSTSFGGDVSGTYNSIVVADDSHNHIISNVDGLQTALDGKLSTTGKAADSNLLDGIDSGSFLRSDANDTATGQITFSYDDDTGNYAQMYVRGPDNHSGIVINPVASKQAHLRFYNNGTEKWQWRVPFQNSSNAEMMLYSFTEASDLYKFNHNGTATFNGGTVWTSANDGSGSGLDADNLDGYTWDSSGKNVRATEFYADNWFRNYNSGEGLYNQATTQHFYSDNDDYWNIAGGSGANGIRFRDEHAGTIRGYVYANNSNQIGFLDSDGQWAIRHTRDSRTEFLINNTEYAEINTDYLTHTSDIRTPIFYDSNNTGYYLDPAGTSKIDEILIGGGTVRLRDATGSYGSLECDGGGTGGWEGFSIGGRFVFMHNNSNNGGIYNDVDNEWFIYCARNSYTQLRFNGSTKVETTSTGVTVTGDVNSTSDIKLKKNIETIDSALDKVLRLRGVYFDWKEEEMGTDRNMGLIAQEVEKIIPEVVTEIEREIKDDTDANAKVIDVETIKNVSYGNITAILIEAIKEQQNDINNLKEIISNYELKTND